MVLSSSALFLIFNKHFLCILVKSISKSRSTNNHMRGGSPTSNCMRAGSPTSNHMRAGSPTSNHMRAGSLFSLIKPLLISFTTWTPPKDHLNHFMSFSFPLKIEVSIFGSFSDHFEKPWKVAKWQSYFLYLPSRRYRIFQLPVISISASRNHW